MVPGGPALQSGKIKKIKLDYGIRWEYKEI
jgi:hypothetical protein